MRDFASSPRNNVVNGSHPEYRLMEFLCEELQLSLVDFIEICTNAYHGAKEDGETELTKLLHKKLGKQWFARVFCYAKRQIRVCMVEEVGENNIGQVFERHYVSNFRMKEIATQYCERVAAKFSLTLPLKEDQSETTD